MEQYVMKGGHPLCGEVVIGGAKNASLGVLAAAVMTDGECLIENMPDVRDTNVMLQAIAGIGGTVTRLDANTVRISGKNIRRESTIVDGEYIRKIRTSYYLLGALLGKYKRAVVALPGGCDIGSRPIDQHIKGFRALGAKVEIANGMITATAEHLVGAHIYMDVVSVGATINVMMAAALAEGRTIIENAAKEPHIVDVANFLNSMGANIKGAGTDVIRIRGVELFHGSEYAIIPAAAAATHGDITVKNVIPKHLEAISAKLAEMGCTIHEYDDAVRVDARDRKLTCTQIKTLPYPGFPTDMQPQMAVALALSEGTSVITESIFENRFKYVDELVRMGATIQVEGNVAIITGIERYTSADIVAPDLRAGAALVIAALSADGYSTVDSIQYIQRGYERFDEKLRGLGAEIALVGSEREIQEFKYQVV